MAEQKLAEPLAEPLFYRVEEVAALLRVSKSLVYSWSSGMIECDLKFTRQGSRVMVHRDDLAAYVAQLRSA